jgi:hypothetical protein
LVRAALAVLLLGDSPQKAGCKCCCWKLAEAINTLL